MSPRFNPPPNWPAAPAGWTPPPGWAPDPSWGPVPQGWALWVEDHAGIQPTMPVHPAGPATALPVVDQFAGQPQEQKSWIKRHKVLAGAGALVALVVVIAALGGGGDDDEPASAASLTTQEVQEEAKTADQIAADEEAEAERLAEEEAEAAAEAEAELLAEEERLAEEAAAAEAEAAAAAAEAALLGTVSQQNAYRSAVSYLEFSAFSRVGLIDQLEYEEFSTEDAEFAIDRLEAEDGVNWKEQAAASAASYLEFTSFSRAGLIDQLEYEGFTKKQAEYGVDSTGL